jgi:hypothetical protein
MASANLKAAKLAVAYVRKTLTIGASNKDEDVISSGASSIPCVSWVRSTVPSETVSDSWLARLAAATKKAKCGNCTEQNALAIQFLKARNVGPLDLMFFLDGVDHNFVVIGRKPNSWDNKISTWGGEAVICDPWFPQVTLKFNQRWYFASEGSQRMLGFLPFHEHALESWYRWET